MCRLAIFCPTGRIGIFPKNNKICRIGRTEYIDTYLLTPFQIVLSSRLFLVHTYQRINEKSEILFSASVLQKNVICRVGFLYWKENPLSIRTPSTWDSKPEILHFSRLQFHACFQITLDAQVLTHSAHFCWPSKAASEYRAYKKVLFHFLISAKGSFFQKVLMHLSFPQTYK